MLEIELISFQQVTLNPYFVAIISRPGISTKCTL